MSGDAPVWTETGAPVMTPTTYATARTAMKAGDIIAFAGDGFISHMINLFTRCPISHVGIILRERDAAGENRVELLESTTLNGKAGVQRTFLSDRIATYTGRLWWLPLAKRYRNTLDLAKFYAICQMCEGRPYDYRQVAHFALDRLRIISQPEDPTKLFCSELAALALKGGGVLPVWLNTAEFRPHDLVDLRIYANHYYQLSGSPAPIKCFNRRAPEDWRN